MATVPDDKDWTWVLERRCPECGFEPSTLPRDQIGPVIRSSARDWVEILTAAPERLGRRTRDDRWSPLEYGCHVRDVFRLFDERLNLMVTIDDPRFDNWDQDLTAVEDHYEAQDPAAVADQLSEAARAVAGDFEGVEGLAWERPGTRSNGSIFTVETLGRYMVHDVVHHLYDVNSDLAGPLS
jgi:hypothetical protein